MEDTTILSREIAMERVQKGTKWLDAKAPPYWRRNMFDVVDDKVYFRGRTSFGSKCVLALAFEHEEKLKDSISDKVTLTTVMKSFGLTSNRAIELGFKTALNARYNFVNYKVIDEAWSDYLRSRNSLVVKICL